MDENSLQAKLLKYRIPTDRCIADINERVRKVKNNGFSTPINRDEEPVQTIVSGSSLYRMCDGLLMTDRISSAARPSRRIMILWARASSTSAG